MAPAEAHDEPLVARHLVAVGGPERVRVLLREVLLDSLGAASAPLSGPERAEIVRLVDSAVATTARDTVSALERNASFVLRDTAGTIEDKLRRGRLASACGID